MMPKILDTPLNDDVKHFWSLQGYRSDWAFGFDEPIYQCSHGR
jgi:hypothetical protein